jgi:hypothetical protein
MRAADDIMPDGLNLLSQDAGGPGVIQMDRPCKMQLILIAACTALCCRPASSIAQATLSGNKDEGVGCTVEAEEIVTRYAAANNGAGPLWCYGSPLIARRGEDVFASTIETGENVPPLLNTRWQLWHRSSSGWKLEQHEQEYRQREPCPIAICPKGPVFLSVNPSVEPAGATHGRCEPQMLEFDPNSPGRPPRVHTPVWADGTYFTEHSYRGLAADGASGELLLLNINAQSSEQFVSCYDGQGTWRSKGTIRFPIRACYPQVALHDGAAHVLAIGDIVEPVEEWKTLKFERFKREWDYVFRRLFYTYTPDIRQTGFRPPVEIDTVEQTCGHILNLDLCVDRDGSAHLLYLKRSFQYDFIRDKYFPGKPMQVSLEHVVVKDGQVRSRTPLAQTTEGRDGLEPAYARFHVDASDRLYVILAGTSIEGGKRTFGNFIAPVRADGAFPAFRRIDLKRPFHTFFTDTMRGGSAPSQMIDLFGTADDDPNLRYARLRLGMTQP